VNGNLEASRWLFVDKEREQQTKARFREREREEKREY
jgi:hypothetical protein